ncbi:MAG: haloacid dehalogenase-like hydrolase [Candidatus Aminicenantes bacterium]|nr:haloacid dehalogenase-like hydrolase [Candidatus Aminicenantes bacterium]
MSLQCKKIFSVLVCLLFLQCVVFTNHPVTQGAAPLDQWQEGQVKNKIISFVNTVCDPDSKSFVPPQDRIATFDMDGTIMCEKPGYLDTVIAAERLKWVAENYPAFREIQPYKAAYRGDEKFLDKYFLMVLETAFQGYSQENYYKHVQDFISTRQHPRFKVPYGKLFYAPMLQLIKYLEANKFTVYIVSGSEQAMVRAVCEKELSFECSRLIGSFIGLEVQYTDNGPVYLRQGYFLTPSDVKEGKSINIFHYIGKKPVLAFGNSDGDFGMLKTAYSQRYRHLSLLLDHDDSEREYDYPDAATKEQWLQLAKEQDWTMVSIKKDFKAVFDK